MSVVSRLSVPKKIISLFVDLELLVSGLCLEKYLTDKMSYSFLKIVISPKVGFRADIGDIEIRYF